VGTAFATCRVTVTATSIDTVHPTCGTSGSAWDLWFVSHTGEGIFTTWAKPHFYATVNSAGDVLALQSDLSSQAGS
jgi:hypothetical protein